MKRLLGVVMIDVVPNKDVLFKIFEAKNIDNNIDILNDYADPTYEPIILASHYGMVRKLQHEPYIKYWEHVHTGRCFQSSKDVILSVIFEKCNEILNPLEN